MKLEGSCHCGAVRFSVDSPAPYPYMHCYCSICRKTAGAGGYAINLMGWAATLQVEGEADIRVYRARLEDGSLSPAERRFCQHCGSFLWVQDPRWPEYVHPFAGVVDTALPAPPARNHIMLDFKASWVSVPEGETETHYPRYPAEAIVDWHQQRGLYEE